MGDIAKNMGEFAHGGFWILEWGILNVHHYHIMNSQSGFLISAQSDGIVRLWRNNKGFILLKTSFAVSIIHSRANYFYIFGKNLQASSNMTSVAIWELKPDKPEGNFGGPSTKRTIYLFLNRSINTILNSLERRRYQTQAYTLAQDFL